MIVVEPVGPSPEGFRYVRGGRVIEAVEYVREAVVLGLPVIMILMMVRAQGFGRWSLALMGAAALAIGLSGVISRRRVKLYSVAWWRTPTSCLATSWVFDETGITITDGLISTTVRWGALTAFRQERDRLVFMQGPVQAYVLPIRFLDAGQGQLTLIRTLVARMVETGAFGGAVD